MRKRIRRAAPRGAPGIDARTPISFGCLDVSQTLTVAHRFGLACAAAGATSAPAISAAAIRIGLHGSDVMQPSDARSTTMSALLDTPKAKLDFDALYRSSRDAVYAYVLTLLHDRSAAEDVTAQAFERAFRKQHTYDAKRGGERGWLFGVARNAALDELRRGKRTAAMPTELGGAVDVEERALERATVRAALATLKARDRELIALKFHA